MDLFTRHLAERAALHHGVVTREELIHDGATANVVRRHVADGLIVRVHDGVYRLASAPDTFEARCVAACSADPQVVVTGAAAARLWDFRHVFRPEEPIVLVGHDRSPITSGVLLRRTNRLDETDAVRRDDGIRVASPRVPGSTAHAISMTSDSNDSPSGFSTSTPRCRRCGASRLA